MQTILFIAIGGAIGSILRFLLSQKINQWLGLSFPYGIFTVNVLGCLLIGFLSALLVECLALPPVWRMGILVGLLGGFTTFSSFTLDALSLFERGAVIAAISYVLSSVVFCLLATLFGLFLGRNV